VGRVLPAHFTTHEGGSKGDKLRNNDRGRNQAMIKNMVIVLLTMVVIGLSCMTLSDSGKRQDIISLFQEKMADLKSRIQKASDVPKQEALPKVTPTPIQKGDRIIKFQDESQGPVIIRENTTEESLNDAKAELDNPEKEKTTESSAEETLKGIKQRRSTKNDLLSSEELNSILSLLKSAQETLRKTSFRSPPKEEETPVRDTSPQAPAIKKKFSTGPEESG